jgi:hypothetical protein
VSALLVVCSLIASFFVWRNMRSAPKVAAPADSIAAVAPAAQPSDAPATSAALSKDIGVDLAATPSTAKIFLDDVEVTNPFRGRRLVDAGSHTLRVTATGYAARVIRVQFTQDLSFDVALTPAPTWVPAPYRAPSKPAAPATAKAEPRAAPIETAPPAAAPPQPKPNQPGDSLQAPARKSPATLDTGNPWK